MVRVVLLGSVVASMCLVVWAWYMPPFSDPAAKTQWDDRAAEALSNRDTVTLEQCDEAVTDLRTSRNRLMDTGLCVGSMSLTLLMGSLLLGIRQWTDLATIRSLGQSWWIPTLALVFWLALLPAGVVAFWFRLERGDYPPWADTIIIPICGLAFLVIVGLPFVSLLFAMLNKAGHHPARLWALWPRINAKSIFIESVFAFLLVFDLFVLVGVVWEGYFSLVPSAAVFLYLIFSARAGLIRRRELMDAWGW